MLSRPKLAAQLSQTRFSSANLLARYTQLATLVAAAEITDPALRDPDDAPVLACALTAHADMIVSGDHDLLVLKSYGRVRIVSATEALKLVPVKRDS